MTEEQKNQDVESENILRQIAAITQRHISNLENTLAMMRNGHFIDAYNRINGTKDGLLFIKHIIEKNVSNNID